MVRASARHAEGQRFESSLVHSLNMPEGLTPRENRNRMIALKHSVIINRPVEEVFRYVINSENAPKWKSRLLKVKRTSQGPVGVGTTEIHVGKILGWRPETKVEITAYEPDKKVGFKTVSGPLSAKGEITFESVEGGTKVTITAGRQPSGFLKLIGPLVAGVAQKQLETDLVKLKEVLEQQA